MGSRLLKVGDVFLIEKGQALYAKGDEVLAGEPTEHQEYTRDKVVVKGKEFFSKDYLVAVPHAVPKVGEYVVIATEYSGGGTGHGPGDVYPDGHKVTAKPVKGRGVKVSFYQTGSFTAMLENPTVVKKAGAKR